VTDAETLSPTEARLIAAIVAAPGATQQELAEELRVTARYVRMLLSRERVRRALDASARATLAEASSMLGNASKRVGQSAIDLATGKTKAPASVRLAACRLVIEGASKLVDLVDLEKRIVAMERTRAPGGWPGGRPQ